MLSKLRAGEITHVGTTVFQKPTVNEMHVRPSFGLSLAIEGRIVYRHGAREFLSDPYHLVLLPMGASYTLDCRAPGRFTLVNFLPASPIPTDTFVTFPLATREAFLAAHRNLETAARGQGSARAARLLSAFYELLAVVADETERRHRSSAVAKAQAYMAEHLADGALRAEEIAAASGVSEVYLRRLFLKETGKSPMAYLQRERIAEAKRRLSRTGESVTAIAALCGYSDVYVFCHAFKRETGKTPTEYRAKTHGIL